MGRRLPSLNALRALEAAGRHGSFTRAAEELEVTPGAISRQIKLLEDSFGVELFERKGGGLAATPTCAEYTRELTATFDRVERMTRRLIHANHAKQLNVSCSMTFTLRWLVPRMLKFQASNPCWELRLTAPVPPPRLVDVDVAEVFLQLTDGRKLETDLVCERMFGNDLIPVCSPRLLEAHQLEDGLPLGQPSDLSHHHLLHSVLRPDHWRDWLAATGTPNVDPDSGVWFDSSTLAYQAAIEGAGIAMGQVALVLDELLSGRLVTPFPVVYVGPDVFQLVWSGDHSVDKARDFRDWVMEEAAITDAAVRKFVGRHDTVEFADVVLPPRTIVRPLATA
jgi:LysR family glycine cleavage system transcriptional activator